MTAIRARHEITPLITLQKHSLDTAEVLNRWSGPRHDFSVPVILSTPNAKLDLVALQYQLRVGSRQPHQIAPLAY
jgi:hypothetical protein